jgi:hypothetical protein
MLSMTQENVTRDWASKLCLKAAMTSHPHQLPAIISTAVYQKWRQRHLSKNNDPL